MQQGLSIREFARRDGCSDTLVRKALKRGKLIAFEDGSIDQSLVGTPWRKQNSSRPPANSDGGAVTESNELVSHAEAQRRKENYLARLRQLEFEVKSGRLVDAAEIRRELDKQARQVRDQILGWPSRVAPLTAAEFGIDQVAYTIHLERQVRELLAGIADPEFRGPRH
jgi:hypothetical protein